MPIISKETWDKIPEAEQYLIKKHFEDLYEEKQECEDKQDVIYYNGGRAVMRELFGKEQLQPKPLTYEDVVEELFDGEDTFYISDIGSIVLAEGGRLIYDKYKLPNNCTSRKQAEKLLTINRLMNVAKFLNKDWKPDWENGIQYKWFIRIVSDEVVADYTIGYIDSFVYFRTEELAKQAIQILGENTVRLALSSDF